MRSGSGACPMELRSLDSVDRTALRWLRTSESPTGFALLSGEAPVATLTWSRGGGSLATASTAHGTWTLKRAGFLSPQVTVRAAGATTPVAQLVAHLRRHEIRIRGGPARYLYHVSHLLPSWRVTDERGTELLHIEPVAERRTLEGGAVMLPAGNDATDTLLLLVISWYFIVLAWLEDELVEALAPFEGPDAPVRLGWPD